MAEDDATLALCGPCRHFDQALSGRHRCALGLPLLDGDQRTSCASFSPFALGEGSQLDQSDCCAQAAGPHEHAPRTP